MLDDAAYAELERKAARLESSLRDACSAVGVPAQVTRAYTLVGIFFAPEPIVDYAGAQAADHERYAQCFHGLFDRGVFFAPSGYETLFVSLAHDDAAAEQTAAAFGAAIATVAAVE